MRFSKAKPGTSKSPQLVRIGITTVTNLISAKFAVVIASALLLSGCASIGSKDSARNDPINRLASSVTEAGTRVWSGTRHLFKLKDRSGSSEETLDEFHDEVDMALLDAEVYNAMDSDAAQPTALDEKPVIEGAALDITVSDADPLKIPEAPQEEIAAADTAPATMGASDEDLFHVIGENETLWVLAKMLTGNANNWRTLAEINGLDENGAVYVGQKIRIPGNLKRVPLDSDAPAAENTVIAKTEDAKPLPASTSSEGESQLVTVQAGESMWFLAKRMTGNPENWLAIAEFNGMDERAANLVRYGQKLKIPSNLLIDGATDTVAEGESSGATKALPKTEAADAVAKAILPKGANDAIGVASGTTDGKRQLAAADAPASEDGKLVTVPANFQSTPPTDLPKEAKKAGEAHLLANKKLPVELQSDEIMVSGTYYPKAIYNEANFSSSLLMRVSPGTKLKVSKAIGPWYQVKTDKGVGFVHSRDTN